MKPSTMLIGATGDCNDMDEFMAIEAAGFDKLCNELDRQYDEMREKIDRCIEAPVDRNGVPIRPGDVIDVPELKGFPVERIALEEDGGVVIYSHGTDIVMRSLRGKFPRVSHHEDDWADIINDARNGHPTDELVERCKQRAAMTCGE